MNPELERTINALEQQISELLAWKKSLEAAHSIPLNIDQSFKARFTSGVTNLLTSTKSASSENQAVHEGGVANYSVLKPPDLFMQFTKGGVIYYVPLYT